MKKTFLSVLIIILVIIAVFFIAKPKKNEPQQFNFDKAVGYIYIPSALNTVNNLMDYVNTIHPGSERIIKSSFFSVINRTLNIDIEKYNKPMLIYFIDNYPNRPLPVVIYYSDTDKANISPAPEETQETRYAIFQLNDAIRIYGSKTAVDIIKPYFQNIKTLDFKSTPEKTLGSLNIDINNLNRIYGQDIRNYLQKMQTQFANNSKIKADTMVVKVFEFYEIIISNFLEQTDKFVFNIDYENQVLKLNPIFNFKENSALAGLCANNQPLNSSIIKQLVTDKYFSLYTGKSNSAHLQKMWRFYSDNLLKKTDKTSIETSDKIAAVFNEYFELITGNFAEAVVIEPSGLKIFSSLEIKDAESFQNFRNKFSDSETIRLFNDLLRNFMIEFDETVTKRNYKNFQIHTLKLNIVGIEEIKEFNILMKKILGDDFKLHSFIKDNYFNMIASGNLTDAQVNELADRFGEMDNADILSIIDANSKNGYSFAGLFDFIEYIKLTFGLMAKMPHMQGIIAETDDLLNSLSSPKPLSFGIKFIDDSVSITIEIPIEPVKEFIRFIQEFSQLQMRQFEKLRQAK